MNTFKKQILATCKKVIDEKLNDLFSALKDITDSANNESKSSAGDKHETGRAMMQIEQEKLGKQIQEWETQKSILDKIDLSKPSNLISLGSLVETNKGLFFMAANVGKIKVEDKEVMVISLLSPLGACLMKHQEGDEFEFNKNAYKIMQIC